MYCARLHIHSLKWCRSNCKLFTTKKFSFLSSNHVGKVSALQQYRPLSTKTENDNINNTVNVYDGKLTPQIRAVKMFSIMTSAGGLLAQPILIQKSPALGGLPLTVVAFSIVGFFTFVTPILLHLITKKYVIELLYNKDTGMYTAVTYNFFLRRKEITFSPDEVKVPEVPGMFTSFCVRDVPLFVDPRMFVDTSHYARIMGYDKPIDLKLGHYEDSNNKSSSS